LFNKFHEAEGFSSFEIEKYGEKGCRAMFPAMNLQHARRIRPVHSEMAYSPHSPYSASKVASVTDSRLVSYVRAANGG
jgi:dTDP-D-glucose 4,6-dehydratase